MIGQVFFERENNTIGNDSQQDHVLEGAPLDDDSRVLSDDILFGEDEQRSRVLARQAQELLDALHFETELGRLFLGLHISLLVFERRCPCDCNRV